MANKKHLEQYDEQGNRIPIYLNDDEVMSGGTTLGERLDDIEDSIGDTPTGAAVLNENSGRVNHNKAPVVVMRYIHQNGTDDMSLDDLNAGDVYADAGGSLELVVIENGSKTVKNIGTIDKGLIFYSIREEGFFRYLGSAAWELLSQGGGEEQEGTFAELDVDSRLKHIQSPVMVLDCISQSEEPGIADCPIGGYYCYMGNQASDCRIRYRKAKVTAGQYEDIDLSSPQGHVLYYNKPEDKTYHWDGQNLIAVLWHAGLAIDNRLMSSRATAVVLWYISANLVDGEIHMDPQSGDVYCDSNNHIIVKGGTVNPNKEYVVAANLPTTPDADLGLPDQKLVYYDVNKKGFYRWNGVEWKKALNIDIDTANLVTITQLNNTLSSYATKSELAGKQDKLTGSDVLATINSTQVHYGESVNVIGQKGEKGDKGDTGNVQVDGNGNVLIYNGLDMRQTGAALDAYQGYVLALTKGTFAQAWLKSQFVIVPFCWVLSDTIDGDTILKPIWYVGNGVFVDAVGAEVLVEAESVPVAPTMTINGETPTSGAEVPKNTQVVITPAADSVLYYKIGSGDYMKSAIAVTLSLTNEGTNVIDAYCANNKGNSTHNELSLSVAGVPVPVFGAAQGTTINGTVVSRGGSIVISGDADGDLYYKVGDAARFTQVHDTGGAAPQATVQISGTGSTVIEAYNSINGDTSQHVTMTYTMVALTPPTMAMSQTTETANEFPLGGGTLSMSAPSGTIHYTTDDSTPTESSTQYNNTPISISSRTTVKAIAHDTWGNSEVVTNTYTVKQPKIKVEVNDATTMSLGDTGLTAIPLDGPTGSETTHINEFTIEDLNDLAGTSYASLADHVFASLAFGDKMKIVSFDGGGMKINSLNNTFKMATTDSPLKKVVGIVLAPIGSTGANADSTFNNDYKNPSLAEVEISGEINGSMANFIAANSGAVTKLDLSGLTGTVTAAGSAFKGYKGTVLDITGLEINASSAYGMFRALTNCTILKIKKVTSSGTVTNMFTNTAGIKTLISTNEEPYNAGWLADIGNGLTAIYVPDDSVSAYKAHASWSAYEDKIFGISNYNE